MGSRFVRRRIPGSLAPTQGQILLSDTAVTAEGEVGGPDVAARITISDGNAVHLTGVAVVGVSMTSGAGWLSAAVDGGVLTILLATAGLAAGTVAGSVTVGAANAPSRVIPVSFTLITPAASLLIPTPASVQFDATAGAASPAASVVTIQNGTNVPFVNLAVGAPAYGSGSGWLAPTLDGPTATVTLTPSTGALAAGTYTATVDVTADNASNSPQTITVTAVVAAAAVATIVVADASVGFTATEGGASPTPATVAITNGGGGTLAAVSAAVDAAASPWLAASVAPGTAGNSQTLTLTPTTGALTAGAYAGTVTLSAPGSADVSVTVACLVAAAGVYAAPMVVLPIGDDGTPFVHDPATDTITGTLIDTTYTLPAGTVRRVVDTGNPAQNVAAFNTAQNQAVRGDIIVWDDGMTFGGPLKLKDYGPGTTWVYYMPASEYNRARGAVIYGSQTFPVAPPVQGERTHWSARRVPRTAAQYMGTVYGTTQIDSVAYPAIATTPSSGCSYIRLIGMYVTTNPAWTNVVDATKCGVLVHFGSVAGGSQRAANAIPHHLILDRCILRPQAGHACHRGFIGASEWSAIIGCRIIETKGDQKSTNYQGGDCQAVWLDNSRYGWLIEGSELEGGDEVILMGYSQADIGTTAMSDIVVRGNWVHHETDGTHLYRTKNCIETKGCQRWLIEQNVVSHLREDAQTFAFNLKVVSEPAHPYVTTRDLLVRYNYVHHVSGALSFSGIDANGDNGVNATRPSYLQLYNNWIDAVNVAPYTATKSPHCVNAGGWSHVWLHNNTITNQHCTGSYWAMGDPTPVMADVNVRDNIGGFATYGYSCPGHNSYTNGGALVFNQQVPGGYTWSNDVLYGVAGSQINADHSFKAASWAGRGHRGYATEAELGIDATGHLPAGSALLTAGAGGGPVGVMNWTFFDASLFAVEG